MKVVGITVRTDMEIAAHAICVRTAVPFVFSNESFLRFHSQNKHNVSYFTKMSWTEQSQSKDKITKKTWYTKILLPEKIKCYREKLQLRSEHHINL